MLRIFDDLPPGLLAVDAPALARVLGGPALIHVPGAGDRPPLFVATLLHGNETTGWNALRRVLAAHPDPAATLPRPLLLFLGNVEAAHAGVRHLDGQPDFNRIWSQAVGAEAGMAAQVLAAVRRAAPMACIDIHNTSGENPVYACVHRLDAPLIELARRFGSTAVLVTHPESMLSMALTPIAPAITLECGKPGNAAVTAAIADSLLDLMQQESLEPVDESPPPRLLRTAARVHVDEAVTFTFGDASADLRFEPGLDRYNFDVMPAGTPIARVRPGVRGTLVATDEHGSDVSERFFRLRGDALVAAVPWIPSLFSANERIVRQDCLCYVMEPL